MTALPPVPQLVGELTTPTYTFANEKFFLEDKDQIKSRLGRSPDLAYALTLTSAIADMPAEFGSFRQQRHRALTDFDPYAEDRYRDWEREPVEIDFDYLEMG